MGSGSFRFERFTLDPEDRRLRRDGAPVELNGRYLDALALLVREQGRLVTKDRFLEEVWRGAPVTDEALTQCVRTLRRRLGDAAARPRFIETVPKHGYRFVAPVEWVEHPADRAGPTAPPARERTGRQVAAGLLGGGAAGVCGGLFYGFASLAEARGAGGLSTLLVLLCVNILVGLLGGAGVAAGVCTARRLGPAWSVAGGALGGLATGGAVKLVGLDAFALLFGSVPGDMTGPLEGALLGGAIGFGAWIADRGPGGPSLARGAAAAGLAAAAAGAAIPQLGGRLMGGSLDLLARAFPGSHLRLDALGRLFGERGFGPATQTVTGALEGLLFGAGVAGAMILAVRRKRHRA